MNVKLLAFTLAAANAFAAAPVAARRLPISFESNRGQFESGLSYGARTPGLQLGISTSGVHFEIRRDKVSSLDMIWAGASDAITLQPEDQLPGKVNYIFGSNSEDWKTNLPTYRKVRAAGIYKGIDLVLYGNESQLEYDLVLAPGADVKAIALEFKGAQKVTVSKDGDLVLQRDAVNYIQHRPRVYQVRDGRSIEIPARYTVSEKSIVGFEVESYDHGKQLVIDPELAFSALFGGSGTDSAQDIALDSQGNIYIVGSTSSPNFPVAQAYRNSNSSGTHMFVTKLDPAGSTVLFSTYLGGSGSDNGYGIAVSAANTVYLTGSTDSLDYPLTPGALSRPDNVIGKNIALTQLDSSGSTLIYSTVIGGRDEDYATGLAIDAVGKCLPYGRHQLS
jgi:hypothetical protein